MKTNNPMFNNDVKNKVSCTRKKKFASGRYDYIKNALSYIMSSKYKNGYKIVYSSEKISERMKRDNPMFNDKTREKVSNTLKAKILSGEIKYTKGKDHYLYKGGRSLGMTIRSYLSNWIKNELIKNDYTCSICGKKGGTLHVHHKKPLRDIINEILLKYNKSRAELNINDPQFDIIIKEILNYHYNNDIGQVVCPICHSKIDKYYYTKK